MRNIRDISEKIDRFDRAARQEKLQSPQIIQKTKAVRFPLNNITIFKVQSTAPGDGIYNCYEQILNATEWIGTSGNPKFIDKNTTAVEVLNLNEYDPEAGQHNLPAGCLLEAWQTTDDEGNRRWVGQIIIPLYVCEEP